MHIIGEALTVDFYTTNAAGAAANCDATPTVKVTGPGVTNATVTPTNPATGQYRIVYTPTLAGVYSFKFTGLMSTVAVAEVVNRTVHDGVLEGQGESFPDGIASWESAVS